MITKSYRKVGNDYFGQDATQDEYIGVHVENVDDKNFVDAHGDYNYQTLYKYNMQLEDVDYRAERLQLYCHFHEQNGNLYAVLGGTTCCSLTKPRSSGTKKNLWYNKNNILISSAQT